MRRVVLRRFASFSPPALGSTSPLQKPCASGGTVVIPAIWCQVRLVPPHPAPPCRHYPLEGIHPQPWADLDLLQQILLILDFLDPYFYFFLFLFCFYSFVISRQVSQVRLAGVNGMTSPYITVDQTPLSDLVAMDQFKVTVQELLNVSPPSVGARVSHCPRPHFAGLTIACAKHFQLQLEAAEYQTHTRTHA